MGVKTFAWGVVSEEYFFQVCGFPRVWLFEVCTVNILFLEPPIRVQTLSFLQENSALTGLTGRGGCGFVNSHGCEGCCLGKPTPVARVFGWQGVVGSFPGSKSNLQNVGWKLG